jgi:hypothetical protein
MGRSVRVGLGGRGRIVLGSVRGVEERVVSLLLACLWCFTDGLLGYWCLGEILFPWRSGIRLTCRWISWLFQGWLSGVWQVGLQLFVHSAFGDSRRLKVWLF